VAGGLVQAGGWAEEDSYGVQDWELFSRAVLAGYRLEVVPRALYWYRTNSQSMLRSALFSVNNQQYLRPYLQQCDPPPSPPSGRHASVSTDSSTPE
jgi:hypothetical protein